MSRSAFRPFIAAFLAAAFSLVPVPPAVAGRESETGAKNPPVVKDDMGFAFPLGTPPRRIVSLAPNITEILFAIGLEEQVAGVTRYCDHPPATSTKKRVGGLADPDLETIQALEPDLVLAYRGNPLQVVRKMRALGLPVFVLDEGRRLDRLGDMISRIGRVTRREPEAEALARRLEEEREGIRSRLGTADSRPRAFLLLHGDGLWTCGSQTHIHDLLDQASAVNIAASIPRPWAPFSREKLLAEDPDVLVLLAPGRKAFEDAGARLKADPRLRRLKAVRLNRFIFIDENKASRFGPRLVEVYAALARALHPECFREN